MTLYLRTKTLLVSVAFCSALHFRTIAEAQEAFVSRDKDLTTSTTTLLAQNRLSESQTKDLLNHLDKNTRDFQRSIDRALDDSRLNNSKGEDNINDYLKDFKDSTKRLRDRYYFYNTLSSRDVREVFEGGAKIDALFNINRNPNNNRNSNNGNFNHRNFYNANLRQKWQDIRVYLDILALSSYGRNPD